jgi:predicted aspartyl protease
MRRAAHQVLIVAAAFSLCSVGSGASSPTRLSVNGPQYRIKLGPFVVPPARTAGLEIDARINGGPPFRLLLDSGAQCLVLDRRAAEKSRITGGTDLDLVGAGAPAATLAKMERAETVQVGGLVLRDVPVVIEKHKLADGIQGVLPLSMFAAFLIRLDLPAKRLDLLPYPAEPEQPEDAIATVSNHRLLFVKGAVNEKDEGYFLIDTGASYSAISETLARNLRISESLAERVPLQAGTAALNAPLLRGSVRLRLGSTPVATDSVVAVDLSTGSRYHHLEISGLIGYPALSASVLTVSYRDKFIRIESR